MGSGGAMPQKKGKGEVNDWVEGGNEYRIENSKTF